MGTPTLTEFYGATYSRVFLTGTRPATFAQYAAAGRHWRDITGDPPLDRIDTLTLATFKAALLGQDLAPATVNKHLRLIGAILAKAGPSGPRNRDALGLIPATPWTRPCREPRHLPRDIRPATLEAIYRAASAAFLPRIDGIRAAHWWQALIVLAYTTGFRRTALLALRWNWIDWDEADIRLPASEDKAWTERRKPLHSLAIKHLLRIRTAGEKLLPWPYSWKSFYREWHHIQCAAQVDQKDHIGIHDLKRLAGTTAASLGSAWAVQALLDHSSISTSRHYVNPTTELRDIIDRFPIPPAFAAGFSSDLSIRKDA